MTTDAEFREMVDRILDDPERYAVEILEMRERIDVLERTLQSRRGPHDYQRLFLRRNPSDLYAWYSDSGEPLIDEMEELREYTTIKSALQALRRMIGTANVHRHAQIGIIAVLPNGNDLFIGAPTLDPVEFGGHDWTARTDIPQEIAGYGIWQCARCGALEAGYGLLGKPMPGTCPEHPKNKEATNEGNN